MTPSSVVLSLLDLLAMGKEGTWGSMETVKTSFNKFGKYTFCLGTDQKLYIYAKLVTNMC